MVLEQLQVFIEMVDDLNNISKLESVEDIRDLDPTKIYNIYKGLKSLKKNFHGIDEDMFPTLTEIFLYQNQLSRTSQNKIKSKNKCPGGRAVPKKKTKIGLGEREPGPGR